MSLKTVKINVEIGNKDTLQNELNNLGKDVSLKIDLTETNASLKSLVNGIASLNSKLNDIDFSKLKGIGASAKESNKELKETTNVLKEMSGKETKVTIVTNSKGSKKEIK